MVTLNNLRSQSSKDLAKFARSEGIPGWHNMRKEQLIQALTRLLKRRGQPSPGLRPTAAQGTASKGVEPGKALGKKSSAPSKTSTSKPPAASSAAVSKLNSKQAPPRPVGRDAKTEAVLRKPSPTPAKSPVATAKKLEASGKPQAAGKSLPEAKGQPVRKPIRGPEAGQRTGGEPRTEGEPRVVSAVAIRMQQESLERERLKNLALSASLNKDQQSVSKDRVVLIVRDSYWLQAYWEVTEQTVRRARTALEKHWRGAVPVLRLFEFTDDDDQLPEKPVRDIEVHGGVDTWFIDTANPPKSYRVAIGFTAPNGRFYMIAKSNKVTTPVPSGHRGAGNWADIAQDCENFFALSGGYTADNDVRELQEVFEEKLRRPMAPLNPSTAIVIDPRRDFQFEVDAQMVVYGVAAPGSSVTLAGEPLKIDPDGTFSVRMDLPDKRQVLPVVACSRDGAHQRTTVLSIERNTKVMEPVNMDIDEP